MNKISQVWYLGIVCTSSLVAMKAPHDDDLLRENVRQSSQMRDRSGNCGQDLIEKFRERPHIQFSVRLNTQKPSERLQVKESPVTHFFSRDDGDDNRCQRHLRGNRGITEVLEPPAEFASPRMIRRELLTPKPDPEKRGIFTRFMRAFLSCFN